MIRSVRTFAVVITDHKVEVIYYHSATAVLIQGEEEEAAAATAALPYTCT